MRECVKFLLKKGPEQACLSMSLTSPCKSLNLAMVGLPSPSNLSKLVSTSPSQAKNSATSLLNMLRDSSAACKLFALAVQLLVRPLYLPYNSPASCWMPSV